MRHSGGVILSTGVLLVAGLAATGCARVEHPTVAPQPSTSMPAGVGEFEAAPSPSPSPTPAQAAGGTCRLLDYDSIERITGTHFDVAAASTASGAHSCALQVLYSDHPDMVVSVVGTDADAKAFGKAAPDNSSTVKNLGSAAYSRVIAAGDGAGPMVEIGWLGKHSQIVTLRYTYAKDVSGDSAVGSVGRLIDYARSLEAKR